MSDGQPLEPGQTRKHSDLEREREREVNRWKQFLLCYFILVVIFFMSHINDILHLPKHTFSTNLRAAAFSPFIVVSCRGWVMREGRTVSTSHGLPAPQTGPSLPLVCELPLDDADLLSQGFGPTRLTDAMLS